MSNPIYDIDRAIASASQSTALQDNRALHAVRATGNWWGGPGVIWFSAALWLGARALRRSRASLLGLRGLEAIAISSAISSLLKVAAGRARPFVTPDEPWHWEFFHSWSDQHYFSFPSGHTTTTVALSVVAGMVASRWPAFGRHATVAVAVLSAVVVGFARIYSRQHWFSDVIAGVVLGTLSAVFVMRLHRRHPGSAFDRVLLGASAAGNA
jgi:undecaprenyl-diphosphatase